MDDDVDEEEEDHDNDDCDVEPVGDGEELEATSHLPSPAWDACKEQKH